MSLARYLIDRAGAAPAREPNRAQRRAGARPHKPPTGALCAGCGRTARRMIRLRDLEVARDMEGRELSRGWVEREASYCHDCTPEDGVPA